jgi:hypothetical protein
VDFWDFNPPQSNACETFQRYHKKFCKRARTFLTIQSSLSGITPGTFPVHVRIQNVHTDVHVIHDLEVVHSDTQEVGSRLESKTESIVWTNCARRKHFESDPRLLLYYVTVEQTTSQETASNVFGS